MHLIIVMYVALLYFYLRRKNKKVCWFMIWECVIRLRAMKLHKCGFKDQPQGEEKQSVSLAEDSHLPLPWKYGRSFKVGSHLLKLVKLSLD